MTKALSIVVLISGTGNNLQAIIEASLSGAPIDIKAVISNNPEAYGLKRAELAGIPSILVPHQDYANRAEFEKALIQTIDNFHPDWIVLAGFMRRLDKAFVDHYPHRILNIHPSLLPKFQGLDTHARVLSAKEKLHGASIHLVDHGLDSGPLLVQAALKVEENDTETSLKTRVMELETQLYPLVLKWLAESRLEVDATGIRLEGQALPKEGILLKMPLQMTEK